MKFFSYRGNAHGYGSRADVPHVKALEAAFGQGSVSNRGDSLREFSGVLTTNDSVTVDEVAAVLQTADNVYARLSSVKERDMNKMTNVYPSEWLKDIHEAIDDSNDGISNGIQEQINKYGEQRITALAWIAVIAEEFGEMVAEYNKGNIEDFEMEAKQTMACITRLMHEVRREHNGKAEAEADLYVRHS